MLQNTSAFIHHLENPWSFAIRVRFVTRIVTGVGATVNPYIEYYADNLPERRLAASVFVSSVLGKCVKRFQSLVRVAGDG